MVVALTLVSLTGAAGASFADVASPVVSGAEPTTVLVSRAMAGNLHKGRSYNPVVSGDGDHVAFVSSDPDVGALRRRPNAFVWDRDSDQIRLVSGLAGRLASDQYVDGLDITDDGGIVVFDSAASLRPEDNDGGLQDLYLWRAATGRSILLPRPPTP